MSDFHTGAARQGDPATSVAAAASVNAAALEDMVVEDVRIHGSGTWDEISRHIEIPRASVSPRFRPLRDQGRLKLLLDDKGAVVTRTGKSGRKQQVHVLGSGAKELQSRKFNATQLEAAVRCWLKSHTQPDIEMMCKDIIEQPQTND